MKNIVIENSFKKDLKRLQKRGYYFRALYNIIELLKYNNNLPRNARQHKLKGEYQSFWECHIENDWLLIYQITETELLLLRTGSHLDLFE